MGPDRREDIGDAAGAEAEMVDPRDRSGLTVQVARVLLVEDLVEGRHGQDSSGRTPTYSSLGRINVRRSVCSTA